MTIRGISRCGGLLLLLYLLQACSVDRDVSKSELHRKADPVMVWGGESSDGYLKVELWDRGTMKHKPFQELIVYHPDGELETYSGLMTKLPQDLHPAPGAWQVFVRLPEYPYRLSAIVAMQCPNGTLRLYLNASPDLRGPCEVRPVF